MIKKTVCLFLIILFVLLISACGKASGNGGNGPSAPSENTAQANASPILDIVACFDDIRSNGNSLFACFDVFNSLNSDQKYKKFKEAETYTSLMDKQYDSITEICKKNSGLENIASQIRLLKNLVPGPVENNSQSIENATILYQLYLQQISSSFNFLSEDMKTISNGTPLSDRTSYYDEVPKMAKPDTVIYDITFLDSTTENNIIKYTYNIGKDITDAQLNYNLYLIAIGQDTGLSVKIDGSAAYIYENNQMVSAIMSGTDEKLGYFFMVTFPKNKTRISIK